MGRETVLYEVREGVALRKQAINRMQEAQGFRAAMLQATEVGAVAHCSPPVLETNARIRAQGLKATIADWQAGVD